MSEQTESSSIPAGWKAGAKALAAFQKDHTGVAKGGQVDGGPRRGSKYATLVDILRVCAKAGEHGLSHSGQARLLGENMLVWREHLHHESGESIYTEHPIMIPTKGLPGQIQQELGGAITYARKYCCQALFGLYADDGMDPDADSYEEAASTPAPAPATVAQPIVVAQQQQPLVPDDDSQAPLTPEQIQICKKIVGDEDNGAEFKAKFLAKFYPSAEKLRVSMLKTQEHLQFLDQLQIATAPF